MTHRQPTHRDIGKIVEVRNHDNDEWQSITLASIDYDETGPLFWSNEGGKSGYHFWYQSRIPISTTNASDELAVAADMLTDVGLDVASEVLRKEAERIVRWNEIEMGIYEHSDETPNNQRSR